MTIQNAVNIDNTFVGKGIVKFMLNGEIDYRDLGEVPEFEFEMTVDKLDYFSSRIGCGTRCARSSRKSRQRCGSRCRN